MFCLAPKGMQTWEPYVHYADAFTPEECARIIALHVEMEMAAAMVGDKAAVDPSIRRADTGWIRWCDDHDWIFKKLAAVCGDACDRWYPFNLTGFSEPLQLTRYTEADLGHYSMHRDMGSGSMSTRKLSAVVMLSSPDNYDGGALELLGIPGDDPGVKEKALGTVIVFPAWEMHRVTPVTRGSRWSLVAWAHGPRFT